MLTEGRNSGLPAPHQQPHRRRLQRADALVQRAGIAAERLPLVLRLPTRHRVMTVAPYNSEVDLAQLAVDGARNAIPNLGHLVPNPSASHDTARSGLCNMRLRPGMMSPGADGAEWSHQPSSWRKGEEVPFPMLPDV